MVTAPGALPPVGPARIKHRAGDVRARVLELFVGRRSLYAGDVQRALGVPYVAARNALDALEQRGELVSRYLSLEEMRRAGIVPKGQLSGLGRRYFRKAAKR